jgi:hypothetical protein
MAGSTFAQLHQGQKYRRQTQPRRQRFLASCCHYWCLTMALRRPPTRIELKTDDIAEYHEVRQNLRSRAHLTPLRS